MVYESTNFRGNSREFTSDVVDLVSVPMSGSRNWNDRIGSLRVVSDNGRYGSDNGRYGSDNGRYGRPDYDNGPGYRRGQDRVDNGICVYQDANYQGRSTCWSVGEDIRDLRRAGWNDRISSIRIFGRARAVAFNDPDFRGGNLVIDHNIPNLAQLRAGGIGSWNDHISSMQVEGERNRRASRY